MNQRSKKRLFLDAESYTIQVLFSNQVITASLIMQQCMANKQKIMCIVHSSIGFYLWLFLFPRSQIMFESQQMLWMTLKHECIVVQLWKIVQFYQQQTSFEYLRRIKWFTYFHCSKLSTSQKDWTNCGGKEENAMYSSPSVNFVMMNFEEKQYKFRCFFFTAITDVTARVQSFYHNAFDDLRPTAKSKLSYLRLNNDYHLLCISLVFIVSWIHRKIVLSPKCFFLCVWRPLQAANPKHV